MTKVSFLHQRDRQPAKCRIAGCACTVYASTYNAQVIYLLRKSLRISFHLITDTTFGRRMGLATTKLAPVCKRISRLRDLPKLTKTANERDLGFAVSVDNPDHRPSGHHRKGKTTLIKCNKLDVCSKLRHNLNRSLRKLAAQLLGGSGRVFRTCLRVLDLE